MNREHLSDPRLVERATVSPYKNELNLWLEMEDLMDFQEPLNKMGFSQLRELDKLDF